MATIAAVEAQPRVATKRFYRPELDVLRFLAATSVFFFHGLDGLTNTNFWITRGVPQPLAGLFLELIRSGAYGVDLFFALSSFLITELLLREREEKGSLDIKAFYIRRILRIWPLYFFFIAFAYAFTFVTHQKLPWKYIAGLLLLFGNWVFVFQGPPNSVAGALWTICVEEQFYLAWPQVVKRAAQETIKRVAWLLIGIAALTRVLLGLHGSSIDAFWFNTLARLDPLALGILFALYVHEHDFRLLKLSRIALVIASIGCWFAVTYFCHLNRLPVTFWGSVLRCAWLLDCQHVDLAGDGARVHNCRCGAFLYFSRKPIPAVERPLRQSQVAPGVICVGHRLPLEHSKKRDCPFSMTFTKDLFSEHEYQQVSATCTQGFEECCQIGFRNAIEP